MDKELRARPTLYSIGAFLLAAILTAAMFLILGAALLGCATVKPYTGAELAITYHEEFVSWENVDDGLANKRLYVNNPFSHSVRARFQCGTPLELEVVVPPHSTKVEGIYDIIPNRHAEYAPDACRLDSYEVLR